MRGIVPLAMMGVAAARPFAVATAAETNSTPNFLLVMADDMGVGDVSYTNLTGQVFMPGAGGQTCVGCLCTTILENS